MKKNLLTVLILALLIVNIVLTSVMMFSMVGANKKTSELVDNIAMVLNLELKGPGEEEEVVEVPIGDSVPYVIANAMTIPLLSTDGEDHYIIFNISFHMNKKDKAYKKYGEKIVENEELIKDTIRSVVSSHTEADFKEDFEGIKDEILKAVQDIYDSEFIYKVAISEVKYQ